MKQAIGNFLLRRLQEAGIRHIFGVPGDHNLELVQRSERREKRLACDPIYLHFLFKSKSK